MQRDRNSEENPFLTAVGWRADEGGAHKILFWPLVQRL